MKCEVERYGADADEVGVELERELELWKEQDFGVGGGWGGLFEAGPILTTLRRKGDEFCAEREGMSERRR